MVANWTLGGMFPEQNVAHIALIHIDQPITLLGGECDSYAFEFALPRGLFRESWWAQWYPALTHQTGFSLISRPYIRVKMPSSYMLSTAPHFTNPSFS